MKHLIGLLTLLGAAARAQSALRGDRVLQSLQVTSLQLIRTRTGTVVADLKMNSSIDISSAGSDLSINAVVSGDVRSVRFAYNGNANFNTESTLPFAMCGDRQTVYNPCPELAVGTHTVTVTPFSAIQGTGTSGRALTIVFSLVNGGGPSPPAPSAPAPSAPAPSAPAPTPPVVSPSGPSNCKIPKVCFVF
jgi:hypothetical protein